jgi:hypothetical protein
MPLHKLLLLLLPHVGKTYKSESHTHIELKRLVSSVYFLFLFLLARFSLFFVISCIRVFLEGHGIETHFTKSERVREREKKTDRTTLYVFFLTGAFSLH